MMPMTTTATMMRPSELELPFWNSSQTNFPNPGFCASISAAMSTIHPIPRERRRPVNIIGIDEGRMIFHTLVIELSFSTLETFNRSLSTLATPTAVLMSVGHMQQRVTVTAEVIKDFENRGSLETYRALTIIVTIGSQASGEMGLNTWIIGLMAL